MVSQKEGAEGPALAQDTEAEQESNPRRWLGQAQRRQNSKRRERDMIRKGAVVSDCSDCSPAHPLYRGLEWELVSEDYRLGGLRENRN